MKTFRIVLRTLTIVFGVAIVALLIYRKIHRTQNVISIDYGAVTDFSLTDQAGATVTLASLKGNVWLANFIFTRCQGPCPLIAYKTSELQKEFSDASDLKFVSISVDPDFDTPAVLAKFAASYHPEKDRWYFLTGDKNKVYALIHDGFKLAAEDASAQSGTAADFMHSTYFVLVDRDGHVRGYYNSTDAAAFEKLKGDIKKWM